MMTEPDLCTIGDGASVDDASLIAHINTRGVFRYACTQNYLLMYRYTSMDNAVV